MLTNESPFAPVAGVTHRDVPLFWWQGFSSAWYLTTVFSLEKFECPERGVFVVARRDPCGRPIPLMVGTADDIGDALYTDYREGLIRAIHAGATEIHVHLAQNIGWQMDSMAQDIAAGWDLPLQKSEFAT
ncbi:MAG: hypothetical protein AAF580_05190 [Pseudomonadota bacterium]